MTEPEEHLSPEEQLKAIMAEAVTRDLDRAKRFNKIRRFTAPLGILVAVAALVFIFLDMKDLSRFFGIITGLMIITTGVCNIIISKAENRIKYFIFFDRSAVPADILTCILGVGILFFYIVLF